MEGRRALATLAANEQGKFWPLHDLIFANFNKLNDEKIKELVKEAGLGPELSRRASLLSDAITQYQNAWEAALVLLE